jgi:hypothetical protein
MFAHVLWRAEPYARVMIIRKGQAAQVVPTFSSVRACAPERKVKLDPEAWMVTSDRTKR